VSVHLLIQKIIGPRDELLGPADVAETYLGDYGGEVLSIVVQRLHVGILHPVFPVHLPDDQLGVHDELGLRGLEVQRLSDPRDESPVLRVIVGMDAEELRMLMNDLAVLHDDDGVGGLARVAPGSPVGIDRYHRYTSSLEALFSPSTRTTLARMGSSVSSKPMMMTLSPSLQR